MITDSINQQIASALKARDAIRLSTLRMLSSALNYERIALQHDLSAEEELIVVRRELKKRRDSIEAYQQGNRPELAAKETQEAAILKEYLPAELSEDELQKIVNAVISETHASSLSDTGRVIGEVMKQTKGQVDGSRVSELVKKRLT